MPRSDEFMRGLGLGLTAAMLVPVVISALAPVVRPLARSALKGGIKLYEMGRETFEQLGETVEDIVAEVQEELVEAHEAEELAETVAEEAMLKEES